MDTSMNMDGLKSFALPIAAAVVVVAAVPLAIMPWFNEITTNMDKVSVESARRDGLKTKADALQSFDVSENKLLLEKTVLPAIPSEMDPAGLLGTIEQVARLSGVGLKGITYSDAASAVSAQVASDTGEAQTVDSVMVSISVEGSYEQIANFIARSEMVSRVLTLDTVHIVKGEQGSPNVASFDIRSPYVPFPKTLELEAPFEKLGAAETAVVDHLNMFDDIEYAPTDVSTITGKANPF